MEHFYYCATCINQRHNVPQGFPMSERWQQWCVLHKCRLPKEVGKEHLICSDFEHEDSGATEWQSVITKFPANELWTFTLYEPSRKFAVISELPRVDPKTGNAIDV